MFVTYVTYFTCFKLIFFQTVTQKEYQKAIGMLHATLRTVVELEISYL